MKRMLSFILTLVLLAFASTALAQTQWRCKYCGNTASSISELMGRICTKSPYGTCLAIYNGNNTNNTTNSSNTVSNNATNNKTTSSNTTNSNNTNSRYTYCNGKWTKDNGKERGRLYSVEIRDDGVVVTIEVEATKALKWLGIIATKETYIVVDDIKTLQLTGLMEHNKIVEYAPISRGWNNVGMGETRKYNLFFSGNFPPGVTTIGVKDYGDWQGKHGYSFWNYKINNPRENYLPFNSESEVKSHIDQNNDGICGIYEPVGEKGATLACVKGNGEYVPIIYLSSPSLYEYKYKAFWQIGDVKALLQRTASSIMKAYWLNADKTTGELAYVTFDGAFMHVAFSNGSTSEYLKMYPTASSGAIASGGWTGSGFALRDGYVVTNNHVVKGASSISVVGVNGSSTEMKARVIAVDSKNDLALIKINDSRFSGFGSIPYSVRNTVAEPGTDVFVLGYPMTQYMGEEIKLTTGIISSKSGYQGDITTYQISAPVQPGNSGGPMFDTDGNLIGIVNARIPDAENVGYAIKTSYLFNLINSQVSSSIIPNNNTLAGKSLSDKVRSIRNYVFQIKCK